jgi:thiamine-phosphate pyrophosphorylase
VTAGRLHLVTDDGILARPGFADTARAALEAAGPAATLHLRGHATDGGRLFELAREVARTEPGAGRVILVNDRIDVALAAGADGVQLGTRSIPVPRARDLLGPTPIVGYSAHAAHEAAAAAADGADFVVIGTIFETAAHPGRVAGLGLVRAAARTTAAPVIAIGGMTPDRVAIVLGAGAAGVAVRGGVWDATDPVAAAAAFAHALAGV